MSWFNNRRQEAVQSVQSVVNPGVKTIEEVTADIKRNIKSLSHTYHSLGSVLPVEGTLLLLDMEERLTAIADHFLIAPPTASEQIAVELMAQDYLPSTIAAYRLSRASTKDADLLEQLWIMSGRMDDMLKAIYEHDSAQLAINGNFLKSKFGN